MINNNLNFYQLVI